MRNIDALEYRLPLYPRYGQPGQKNARVKQTYLFSPSQKAGLFDQPTCLFLTPSQNPPRQIIRPRRILNNTLFLNRRKFFFFGSGHIVNLLVININLLV